jgi:hypothetical protein
MGPDLGIQSGTILQASLGCGLCLKMAATVCSTSGSRCTHSAEFWSIRIAASWVMDTPTFFYTDYCFGFSICPSSKTIGWDVRATSSGIGSGVGRWDGMDRSFPIDLRGALEVRLRRSPGMPGRAMVLSYSWDDEDLLFYLLLLHRKPELAPWLLFSPLALGHLKLAYGWWREPIPFLGDSLWVCKIGLGVSSESTYSLKEGLWCFAQGCLWRSLRMKTWSHSYRCAELLLVVWPKGLVLKSYRVVSNVIYIFCSLFSLYGNDIPL